MTIVLRTAVAVIMNERPGGNDKGDQGGLDKSLVAVASGLGPSPGPGELLSCPCEVCEIMTNKMPNRRGGTHTMANGTIYFCCSCTMLIHAFVTILLSVQSQSCTILSLCHF